MRKTFAYLPLAALLMIPFAGQTAEPLKALLITGGCCHDYGKQKIIIPEGVSKLANVSWTVVHEGGTSKDHRISIYEKEDWAKPYDVVVHNECFDAISDEAFIENVLRPHRDGTAAVVVHCAMHTFRALKADNWREFLGVTSRGHGSPHPLNIKNLKPEHPIMKGFPELWTTGNEELYAIDKLWPNATALAQAPTPDNKKQHTVVWTNTYGKGRVFGTTLAHNNATMQHTNYMNMFARGLLWACDKLDDNGNPKAGYGPK